jgi:thioredoxin reductase (NADPH)
MRTPDQIEALFPASDRASQRFPRLSEPQLNLVGRFRDVEPQTFGPSEPIFEIGDKCVPAWFILKGSATLFARDGFDNEAMVEDLLPGQFTGELHALGDRPTIEGAKAGPEGCVALPLYAPKVRALIVGSAELGELIMRAFILRRVSMIERGVGPVIVGRTGSSDLIRLQAFLTRSSYPHLVLDSASPRGEQMIQTLGLPEADLPIVICPCGSVIKRPTNAEAGAWLGITPTLKSGAVYDVAIVGSGPAGLAAAVYAASEGLSVMVFDGQVVGGQAGASARIENFLGFPTGISGSALTGRALNQAQKFGAEVVIPMAASRLDCPAPDCRGPLTVELSGGEMVQARTIVIATGARYRRPSLPGLKELEGYAVHYWASPVEAKLCAQQSIALVGAGNSAGQAIVYLAAQAKHVTVIVRGSGLEASMSRYLTDRIRSLDNVLILTRSEVAELHGDATEGLHRLTVRNRDTDALIDLPVRQLFLFIGAEPNTQWLGGCVDLDGNGYVLTGAATRGGEAPLVPSLQTSLAGVFAIGDVRAGSTKRVAAAVGEGAAVISQIHSLLGAPAAVA